ncbi:MAG: hypothetical protein CBC38_01780 [Gammaproteobacteria bacterium TMED78]|nr:MAG: hypothetical protein CBC38_01780 [Gammaproteobacteria bacterium TMED78]|tara:strand:- start:64486 stop:64890 length:405 start_codon:yes stop_codon:yes gene_type:complete
MSKDKSFLQVVIGLVFDEESNVLINKRVSGKYMEGYWEFPGGKILEKEESFTALSRELKEELGIIVKKAKSLMNYSYHYAKYSVDLDIWIVEYFLGQPSSKESQEIVWTKPEELYKFKMLPSDKKIQDFLLAKK